MQIKRKIYSSKALIDEHEDIHINIHVESNIVIDINIDLGNKIDVRSVLT